MRKNSLTLEGGIVSSTNSSIEQGVALRTLFSRLEMTGNDVHPYSTRPSPSLVFTDVDFSSGVVTLA
jgi:hypothetical protein